MSFDEHGILPGTYVCDACFEEPAVRAFIRDCAKKGRCSYCARTSRDGEPIAAGFSEVARLISEGLSREWVNADDRLPWDSEDQKYFGETRDTPELLEDVGLGVENDDLLRDLVAAIGDQTWCQDDPFGLTPHEALLYGWKRFCRLVKHHTRYLFFRQGSAREPSPDPDDVPPGQVLDRIGKWLREAGVVRRLRTGATVWRARYHDQAEEHTTARDLGAPPIERAAANRMSPAGIPAFYGAEDGITACVESLEEPNAAGKIVTVARWRTEFSLRVVDLTGIQVRSLFDLDREGDPSPARFLAAFARDVARPITKDGREHVEYVPTQVVAEFLRCRFKTQDGERIHGIAYPSAKVPGGTCYVVFCRRGNCMKLMKNDTLVRRRWLHLVPGSVRRVPLRALRGEVKPGSVQLLM